MEQVRAGKLRVRLHASDGGQLCCEVRDPEGVCAMGYGISHELALEAAMERLRTIYRAKGRKGD